MDPKRTLPVALLMIVSLAACGGEHGGDGNIEPPTFTDLYDHVLFVRCADSSCHGGGGGGAGKLDFTTRDNAYAGLVDTLAQGPSCKDSGLTRVEPADPKASLLFLKLSATPPCGSRMPLGQALSTEQQNLIEAWIAGGALDD